MKLHEKLPVHEEKWLAALRWSKNKDLIFTLGSLSSFREKNLQMTLIAKASPALLGRCPWRNELPLSRHLLLISDHVEFIHLVSFVTDCFYFLNFLFYIGVSKAYVLLILLIIFWDSSCKLGNKRRRKRTLGLASKPSKVKFRLWDVDTFPPVETL